MEEATLEKILAKPTVFARALGYNLLIPELHDDWIKTLMLTREDITLQAHRESYKTTCVIMAITMRMLFMPNETTLLIRKDIGSVKEITRSLRKNLTHPLSQAIAMHLYNLPIKFSKDSSTELHSTLMTDKGKKESQFLGDGIRSFSITGKHFDKIYTDDIVTLKDRLSRAERGLTDSIYQELQNVRANGGAIVNTGTPWHKNDTFRIMPKPKKWSVYETGILSKKEILHRRNAMTASLFSANYELKHISDEESLFNDPKYGVYPKIAGVAHIDCAYGGDDTTALTIMCRDNKTGKLFGYGKLYAGHVQDHYREIQEELQKYNAGTLHNETNADKGYFAKEFRSYWPVINTYNESTNKHVKIVTYLKKEWSNITWDEDTDPNYMEQIVDYQEGQDRDDAPDSASSLIREFNRGKIKAVGALSYR